VSYVVEHMSPTAVFPKKKHHMKLTAWRTSQDKISMQVDILDFSMANHIISSRDSGGNTLETSSTKDQGGPSNKPQQQGPSLYDRTMKLEKNLAQFMQVSMSNPKSTESTIKNLEVLVGQLEKQLVDHLSSSFGANTEKNPKEECKAVMTRSRLVAMKESENGIGADKQQLVSNLALEPVVEFLSEFEEELEVEDEKKKETTINLSEQEISEEKNEEKEKEKEEEKEEKK